MKGMAVERLQLGLQVNSKFRDLPVSSLKFENTLNKVDQKLVVEKRSKVKRKKKR